MVPSVTNSTSSYLLPTGVYGAVVSTSVTESMMLPVRPPGAPNQKIVARMASRRGGSWIEALDQELAASVRAVLLVQLDATTRFDLGEWAWRVPIGSRSIGAVDCEERRPRPVRARARSSVSST